MQALSNILVNPPVQTSKALETALYTQLREGGGDNYHDKTRHSRFVCEILRMFFKPVVLYSALFHPSGAAQAFPRHSSIAHSVSSSQ